MCLGVKGSTVFHLRSITLCHAAFIAVGGDCSNVTLAIRIMATEHVVNNSVCVVERLTSGGIGQRECTAGLRRGHKTAIGIAAGTTLHVRGNRSPVEVQRYTLDLEDSIVDGGTLGPSVSVAKYQSQ